MGRNRVDSRLIGVPRQRLPDGRDFIADETVARWGENVLRILEAAEEWQREPNLFGWVAQPKSAPDPDALMRAIRQASR